ncbi:MAG: DNA alkylation repair protein [Bacteroidales bacterium]|nr:DNA alkylation repair protein [Bacteroidales bacterium]MDD4670621.1 DNA alkylation repair protein [Bacteroidales bacterium]
MELTRNQWTEADGIEFQKYLLTLSKGPDKAAWEKRIVNTEMPCIAVDAKIVGNIVREISKGNFMEFLDLNLWDNFTNTSINGSLICKIKDFDLMTKYLMAYAEKIDNWASCDLLKFNIKESNKEHYFSLSQELMSSRKTFVRRMGFTILFKLVDDDSYIDRIFSAMNSFENEEEYYVNMVNAWLFAECFTKQREKTLEYLKTHKLNKFTINKGVQKCRDSFRISPEDKEMLLRFKKK